MLKFLRETIKKPFSGGICLPCGITVTSDWLPWYRHRVLAPVLWPIRSQNSGHSALRNSCWCGPRRCRAVPDLHPPIGMLYLVLITSLRIHKTKIHVRNSNRRRFPLKWQNLTALFLNNLQLNNSIWDALWANNWGYHKKNFLSQIWAIIYSFLPQNTRQINGASDSMVRKLTSALFSILNF